MAKKKMELRMRNYGIYTQWDRGSKNLPKLVKRTTEIPAELDMEFGYILEIKKAKGKIIEFTIEHPPFKDETGKTSPPFHGKQHINSNDFQFFLGDCIWAPVNDKKGPWRLITKIDGVTVADKTLMIK